WPTVLLLLFESALGAWIIRHEGRRAWRSLRGAFETGRLPSRGLADAGLVLLGGTPLLTPGFITDIVGFFLVLPFTRPLARRMLSAYVAYRARRGTGRVRVIRVGGPALSPAACPADALRIGGLRCGPRHRTVSGNPRRRSDLLRGRGPAIHEGSR